MIFTSSFRWIYKITVMDVLSCAVCKFDCDDSECVYPTVINVWFSIHVFKVVFIVDGTGQVNH